jgi:hypothetical protein
LWANKDLNLKIPSAILLWLRISPVNHSNEL